jgi:hypothetical protein
LPDADAQDRGGHRSFRRSVQPLTGHRLDVRSTCPAVPGAVRALVQGCGLLATREVPSARSFTSSTRRVPWPG